MTDPRTDKFLRQFPLIDGSRVYVDQRGGAAFVFGRKIGEGGDASVYEVDLYRLHEGRFIRHEDLRGIRLEPGGKKYYKCVGKLADPGEGKTPTARIESSKLQRSALFNEMYAFRVLNPNPGLVRTIKVIEALRGGAIFLEYLKPVEQVTGHKAVRRAIRRFYTVLDTLYKVHKKGVYQDLSIGNLLERGEMVLLSDPAHFIPHDEIPNEKAFRGDPLFAPPESFQIDPETGIYKVDRRLAISKRRDIYALGVCLGILLGLTPYEGETESLLTLKVNGVDPFRNSAPAFFANLRTIEDEAPVAALERMLSTTTEAVRGERATHNTLLDLGGQLELERTPGYNPQTIDDAVQLPFTTRYFDPKVMEAREKRKQKQKTRGVPRRRGPSDKTRRRRWRDLLR